MIYYTTVSYSSPEVTFLVLKPLSVYFCYDELGVHYGTSKGQKTSKLRATTLII